MATLDNKKISERISRIIYEERKARGMTQIELAAKLGLSQPHLSKIENQTAEPSIVQWFRFCAIFELDSDIISDGIDFDRHIATLQEPKKGRHKPRKIS